MQWSYQSMYVFLLDSMDTHNIPKWKFEKTCLSHFPMPGGWLDSFYKTKRDYPHITFVFLPDMASDRCIPSMLNIFYVISHTSKLFFFCLNNSIMHKSSRFSMGCVSDWFILDLMTPQTLLISKWISMTVKMILVFVLHVNKDIEYWCVN